MIPVMRILLTGTLVVMALGGSALLAQSSGAAADADVVALVDRVLSSAEHPGLKWSRIPDAVPNLKPLYDAEADRLMWFERNAPLPNVERALSAIGAAGDHGLDPADYDTAWLAEQWTSIKAGSASAPERALFDLGLSVAAARLHPRGAHGPRRSADDAVGLYGGAEEIRRGRWW